VHRIFYNRDLLGPIDPNGAEPPTAKYEPGSASWHAGAVGKDLYVIDLFETYLGDTKYLTSFLTELEASLDK
jgi:hypothetical protein